MRVYVTAGMGIVAILAWLPILLKFFRAWRQRKNPVSLAICAVVGLLIYSNLLFIEFALGRISAGWVAVAFQLFNTLVCLYFHMAFVWSRKRFPDARSMQQ